MILNRNESMVWCESLCGAGTYTSLDGCQPCGAGQYQDLAGSFSCKSWTNDCTDKPNDGELVAPTTTSDRVCGPCPIGMYDVFPDRIFSHLYHSSSPQSPQALNTSSATSLRKHTPWAFVSTVQRRKRAMLHCVKPEHILA